MPYRNDQECRASGTSVAGFNPLQVIIRILALGDKISGNKLVIIQYPRVSLLPDILSPSARMIT